MRLINVRTLVLEEFYDATAPPYAILSHTWETEEVLFKDMERVKAAIDCNDTRTVEEIKKKRGFRKIDYVCRQALKDYLEYAWVDTCKLALTRLLMPANAFASGCIDKSSSAELQEAINSMYRW